MKEKANKPWGYYQILQKSDSTDNNQSTTKILSVLPKKELSLQKHSLRDEHWIIIKGNPTIKVGEKTYHPNPNEHLFISKEEIHQIINDSEKEVQIIEVQFGICKEEDIIRLEDKYKK